MRKRRKSFAGGSKTTSYCLPTEDYNFIRETALMRGVSATLVLHEAVQMYRDAQDRALAEVEEEEKAAMREVEKNERGLKDEVEL